MGFRIDVNLALSEREWNLSEASIHLRAAGCTTASPDALARWIAGSAQPDPMNWAALCDELGPIEPPWLESAGADES